VGGAAEVETGERPPDDSLPGWFWWHYCARGALLWIALGVVWWRIGDFESAADLVCRTIALGAWGLGYGLAAFWLGSIALGAALGLVTGIVAASVWVVFKLRG
jgi:hypothetical protein